MRPQDYIVQGTFSTTHRLHVECLMISIKGQFSQHKTTTPLLNAHNEWGLCGEALAMS